MNKQVAIEDMRSMFDHLFLGRESDKSAEIANTLQETGLEDLAKIIEKNKQNGFYQANRPLLDLVQVSMFMYSTMNNLPIVKKLELPNENGDYKFIIACVNTAWSGDKEEKPYIIMLATKQSMHQEIADGLDQRHKNPSFDPDFSRAIKDFRISIIGGGWINIDNHNKTLQANQSSGSFGTLSNEIVEWFLQEKEGYKVNIDMANQGRFDQK